jgi:hypothetical protein
MPSTADYQHLTFDQLCDLHGRLSDEHKALHRKLIDAGTGVPLLNPLGDEWAVIAEAEAAIGRTMGHVSDVIHMRAAERLAARKRADA